MFVSGVRAALFSLCWLLDTPHASWKLCAAEKMLGQYCSVQPPSFMWDPVEPDQLPLSSSVSALAAGQYFSANSPSLDKLENNMLSDYIPSQSRG